MCYYEASAAFLGRSVHVPILSIAFRYHRSEGDLVHVEMVSTYVILFDILLVAEGIKLVPNLVYNPELQLHLCSGDQSQLATKNGLLMCYTTMIFCQPRDARSIESNDQLWQR